MRKPIVLAVAVLGLSAGATRGQADYQRYYVGQDHGRWSDAANWSAVADGTGGAGVPNASAMGLPIDGGNSAVIATSADRAVGFDGDYGTASLVTFDLTASDGAVLTFTHPAGTITARGSTLDSVNGGTVNYLNTGGRHVATDPTGAITLGASSGSNVSYLLTNGGRVQAGYVYVGKEGSGAFNQLSGSVGATTNLYIGFGPGSSGYYALGTGTLSADAETIGHEGAGVVRQTGGTNWAGYSIVVGDRPGSSGLYELAGGQVRVDRGPLTIGVTGTFRQSGGSVTSNGVRNDGTYEQTGGTIATPYFTGGGSLAASGGRIDAGAIRQASIALSGNAAVAASFVRTESIAITDHASLDLLGGTLVLDSGSAGAAWVRGSLMGGQLTSSIADAGHGLGYAVAGDLGMTSVGGEPLSPASVVVTYALFGDANLDGVISSDDYAALDAGMEHGGQWWTEGDFNYDGVVDREDYLMIDRAYLQQCGTAPAGLLEEREAAFGPAYVADLGSVVPEPASLGLLLVAGVAMSARRRR